MDSHRIYGLEHLGVVFHPEEGDIYHLIWVDHQDASTGL